MKKQIKAALYSAIGSSLLYTNTFAQRADISPGVSTGETTGQGYTTLQNPLSSDNFSQLLTKIIDFILFLATPFLVLAIIYVGFQFVMAQGKQAELTKAKSNLLYTLIGAAIIIGVKLIQTVLEGTITAVTG